MASFPPSTCSPVFSPFGSCDSDSIHSLAPSLVAVQEPPEPVPESELAMPLALAGEPRSESFRHVNFGPCLSAGT
jgi:hypothetical protein